MKATLAEQRVVLQVFARNKRTELAVVQEHKHHVRNERKPPKHHFDPPRGRVIANVCPKCPVKARCRALSVELAALESTLLSMETP